MNFYQLVREATRFWPSKDDSLIDHFWTNSPEKILNVRNLARAAADHNVLEVTIRIKGKDTENQEFRKRNWKTFNLENYVKKAGEIKWEEFYRIENLDAAQYWMECKLTQLLDNEAKWMTIQPRRSYRNWISIETKQLMKFRDTIREVARETKSTEQWQLYRETRNVCSQKIKQDRTQHFRNKHEAFEKTNDSKGAYNLMKTQAGWKMGLTPKSFTVNGRKVTAPMEMANMQMEHYIGKVKKIIDNLPNLNLDPTEHLKLALEKWENKSRRKTFNLEKTTELEVLKVIKKIGNSTACGLDGQDTISLKAIATVIYKPLTHLINKSIEQKKFANRWKLARIIPLYKGKDKNRESPDAYRPISLLSVTSKIAERIIQKQLSDYMTSSGQLNPNQHSYRADYSTTTAWLQLTDTIFEATDQNLIATILAVDQSSAFDCVSHTILIEKLGMYGIGPESLEWFRSYLGNRTQCVNIGTKNSAMKMVLNGVPQGSVLGPILYAIYTNELPNILKDNTNCPELAHQNNKYLFGENCHKCGTILCYADDATMMIASKTRTENQRKLQSGLDNIHNFLVANKLAINRTKTNIQEIMIPQKKARQKEETPTLRERENDGSEKLIKSKKECRILGGNMQENMSWGAHLDWGEEALLTTARQKLGVLKHLGKTLPFKTRKMMAEGLILSKIRYLIPIWGGAGDTLIKKVQTLVNDSARFVLEKRTRRDSTLDLMKECKWLTVAEMVLFYSLVLLWKILRKKSPGTMAGKFTQNDTGCVQTTIPRLVNTGSSFRWRTIGTWNRLPERTRKDTVLNSFKINTKNWIIEQRGLQIDPGDD